MRQISLRSSEKGSYFFFLGLINQNQNQGWTSVDFSQPYQNKISVYLLSCPTSLQLWKSKQKLCFDTQLSVSGNKITPKTSYWPSLSTRFDKKFLLVNGPSLTLTKLAWASTRNKTRRRTYLLSCSRAQRMLTVTSQMHLDNSFWCLPGLTLHQQPAKGELQRRATELWLGKQMSQPTQP